MAIITVGMMWKKMRVVQYIANSSDEDDDDDDDDNDNDQGNEG